MGYGSAVRLARIKLRHRDAAMSVLARVLALLAVLFGATLPVSADPSPRPPNILIVTVDDMNWNSVGAFGAPIEGITPHIDALARTGRRYERAYVAASNCSPSRVALQTGLTPQQSGATGFFYIDDTDTPTIATELRRAGYFTGVIGKPADSIPAPRGGTYWDFQENFGAARKYSAAAVSQSAARFIGTARRAEKPFYLVVNIADPHKPNFNDAEAAASGADAYAPSRIIAEDEVSVPGFLPDLPGIRRDVRNYQNSVKRADDTLGAIVAVLAASGLEEETLVIFLSDHGMPFPFAKSSVYDNGLRTPLVIAWSGRIAPGSVESGLVSALDLMPTILDAAGIAMPDGRDYTGRSLLDAAAPPRAHMFGSFDENARGYPVPMRGTIGRDWAYVFNGWSDGEHALKNDDMNHASFKQLVRHAQTDPAVKLRLDYYLSPPVEELCHLKLDPDCLVNLAGDPAHAGVLKELREATRAQMLRTDDYLLEAFDAREDRSALRAFMQRQREAAEDRAARLQWKRPENIAGPTKGNRELFRNTAD
jgi:N-sulfoglucosamine sulfohydrolase